MKKSILLAAFSMLACLTSNAQDWKNTPIPANAGPGKTWQLQGLSDDFNYNGKGNSGFSNRWKDTFINNWSGPGLTEWRKPSSWVSNGFLAIAAQRKPGTNKVYAGCISSKQTLQYPIYMEVRAKVSNLVMASDFWLLSSDSTQEIDVLEAYGSDRPGQEWFAERVHISHHVFIRSPFTDYQPKDPSTWHYRNGIKWRNAFHTYGTYWRDPWHLEYYIDGKLVRTASGKAVIDPQNFTNGTGLNKPMLAIINTEDQNWRSDAGITPTNAELADTNKSIYYVDWVRFYKPVNGGGTPNPSPNPVGNGNTVTMRKGNASGFAIDGGVNGSNGQNASLYEHNGNNLNQQWVEINKGGGYYAYQKKNTNYCLDGGNGGAKGQNVYLWTCSGNNQNQHWKKVAVGGGKYRLEKRNAPGFSIDGNGGGVNGQNIYLWTSNNANANQQWQFGRSGSKNINSSASVNAKIYPNPLKNGNFTIDIGEEISNATITIFNVEGKNIYETLMQEQTKSIEKSIFTSSGLYLIKITTQDKSFTKQLVVE